MTQKGQRIFSDNLQEILSASKNATKFGLQQFFTPMDLARACWKFMPPRRAAVDFQCGSGNLLAASDASDLIGCDIDPTALAQARKLPGHTHLVNADVTSLFPLLSEADWQFDAGIFNPPFALKWSTEKLAPLSQSTCSAVIDTFRPGRDTIDSTLATMLMALDRLTPRGEACLICNHDTAQRLILDTSLVDHIWYHIRWENCTLFQDAEFHLGILFFSRSHQPSLPGSATVSGAAEFAALTDTAAHIRYKHQRASLQVWNAEDTNRNCIPRWNVACDELKRRQSGKRPDYNIWLEKDGSLAVHLTPFQSASVRLDRKAVENLWSLRGQHPQALVVQAARRKSLLQAVQGDTWTVHPDVLTAVNDALLSYESHRAPFMPLSDVQRLGYLDEHSSIACRKTGYGFTEGRTYPLDTYSRTIQRVQERLNTAGEKDTVVLTGQELIISIRDDAQTVHEFLPELHPSEVPNPAIIDRLADNRWRSRHDSLAAEASASRGQVEQHTLHVLLEHFNIPEVPDVAQLFPERIAAAREKLSTVENYINRKRWTLLGKA